MTCPKLSVAATAGMLTAVLTHPLPCPADQIDTGAATYASVTIVGLADGRLHFLDDRNQPGDCAITDVTFMFVDRARDLDDFNTAEEFLAKARPLPAITRYRRALRTASGFWPNIVRFRMLRAATDSGDPERVVGAYLALLVSDIEPAVAARVLPADLPRFSRGAGSAVAQRVDTALARTTDAPRRALLKLLRFIVLERAGDAGSADASARLADAAFDDAPATDAVCRVQAEILQSALSWGETDVVRQAVNRSLAACPRQGLPQMLMIKGRTLAEAPDRDSQMHAGWAFMRVAIHYPDSVEAAEALRAAAGVHERIDRPDAAARLLHECLEHPLATDETRRAAQAALARLEPDPTMGN